MCVDGYGWARIYVYSRVDGGRRGVGSLGLYQNRPHLLPPSTSQSSYLTVTPRPQASVTGALGSAQRTLAQAGSTHCIHQPFSAPDTQLGCAELTKERLLRRPACQCRSWAEEGRTGWVQVP